MNCLNCGGGLRPVGNRSYFRCPYCETFHFPEEMKDSVALVPGDARHSCPVCEKQLRRAAIDGHEVSYCQTCRGFLASNESFSLAVQHRRARHDSPAAVPIPFSAGELQRRILCPGCRKPMDTHPYHAGGNAVIDTCHRCRMVWLDAGELTVIGSYRGKSPPPVRSVNPDGTPFTVVPPRAAEPEPEINLFGFRIRLT